MNVGQEIIFVYIYMIKIISRSDELNFNPCLQLSSQRIDHVKLLNCLRDNRITENVEGFTWE